MNNELIFLHMKRNLVINNKKDMLTVEPYPMMNKQL